MRWSLFRSKGNTPISDESIRPSIEISWNKAGVHFHARPVRAGWLADAEGFGADAELAMLLGQLEEEGFAQQNGNSVCIAWADFYQLTVSPEHASSLPLLRLPPTEAWRPVLSSRETLIDAGFAVSIAGWLDPRGQRPQGNVEIEGAILKAANHQALLPEDVWRVVESVVEFWNRPANERNPESNRRSWSIIRTHAVAAGADMTDFLRKTVVLNPQKLRIGMRKGDVGSARGVIEVQPGFDGEPPRWMEIFDRLPQVPDRYEIPDGNGIVHVLLTPEVKTVLREIRSMPGRRIAGDRAEAFLRNPFATLGPDASKVIDPIQFEQARDDAGVSFTRFTAKILRDEKGHPCNCTLQIEEILQGEVHSAELPFKDVMDLEKFVTKLESRIAVSAQCCHWQGYDLEILGDTPDQARLLRVALSEMAASGEVKASEIFDLSRYSDRVEGFGIQKPYYSPFISRKNDEGEWFPENVDFGLCYTPESSGETVAIALNNASIAQFREEIHQAEAEKRESFDFPGCPKPVSVSWARDALQTIDQALEDVRNRCFDPKKPSIKTKVAERKGLVIKPNVDSLDYEEHRGTLIPTKVSPRLPASLRSEVELRAHQLQGVAWLQHLWDMSPVACRGALLADDMGLGKTIQLLTFIAAAIEAQPSMDPFLIVAPVSLLENWKEEITKFFAPGAMRVLTLYGASLAEKRVPRAALELALVQEGVTRLLVPDWLSGSQVVLTTYETLRDLEFSLAAQRWSVVICDEAQKIKNPNALVTRAAKKQNARLKIACTGTPVENTLTDIWCLFDFVQPGLLGALNQFGRLYRKPIEAQGDQEAEARVAELRALIEPQKLRRTKAEVAKELPRKIQVNSCRSLPLSPRQRALYADAVAAFRQRDKSAKGATGSGLQSPLGLLQYLRRLCSDPRPPGYLSTNSESLTDIERDSPKMAWLLAQLRGIEAKGEKVIVFCEFRDLQRTLQRAIRDRFSVQPDVINGDTASDAANANNRQLRIKRFQDKPGFGVIILSPLAVGFGVNIQAANHVVHFTRTWNPAKEDQATDRAYRIGQTKDVHVYYPVVVAHDFLTFDAKLDKLLDWKRSLSEDMLNGSGDVSPADFGDLDAPDGGHAFGNELLCVDDISSMNPDTFEAFCALLWSKRGYPKTIKTQRVGDGGVDVVAIRGVEGVLIQCKSSSSQDREQGWDGIKDVVAGKGIYEQRHPGVKFSMVVATNQFFNATARQRAAILSVELVDGSDLAELIQAYPMKRGELERYLLAS